MVVAMYRQITWVIKFSKYCNLRCTYCYELPWLGDRTRIPVDLLEPLFEKVKHISHRFSATPKICWHGGEPLLLPKPYLMAASKICDRTLIGFTEPVLHTIQSNLSILTDWHIEFLRDRFAVVGVSFDPFGGSRRHVSGIGVEKQVLENTDRLRSAGVHVGCITVLSRQNIEYLPSIFGFFNDALLSFRVLPYYRSASVAQVDQHGLSESETVAALTQLFDLWLEHGKGISIEPLDQYLCVAITYLTGHSVRQINKCDRERVLIVNTDGHVFAVADTYDNRYAYGNILTDSVDEILNSDGRQKAISDATFRMRSMCTNCELSDSCSGWYAAEATAIERERMNSGAACGVPPESHCLHVS